MQEYKRRENRVWAHQLTRKTLVHLNTDYPDYVSSTYHAEKGEFVVYQDGIPIDVVCQEKFLKDYEQAISFFGIGETGGTTPGGFIQSINQIDLTPHHVNHVIPYPSRLTSDSTINCQTSTGNPPSRKVCLDPSKMNGACDQYANPYGQGAL